jgi:hypothetical protein
MMVLASDHCQHQIAAFDQSEAIGLDNMEQQGIRQGRRQLISPESDV